VALAGAACYLLQALFIPVDSTPFFNLLFARHALLVAALAVAGVRMRERGLSLAPVFITLAGGWFVIASAREYIYLYSDDLPQAFYLLVLVTTAIYAVALKWMAPKLSLTILLGLLLFYTGVFSAKEFAIAAALPLMLAGQIIFSVLAYMAGRHTEEGELVAGVARSMLPLLLLPWAAAFSHSVDVPQEQVVMTLLVSSALFASLQSQLILPHGRYWPNTLSPIAFVIFGAWLFYQSLFHIQRETWAVAYELIALAYLILTVRFLLVAKNRDARLFGVATLLAIASVCAAMLLRLVGPPGSLTILALSDMLLPAIVSLFLAVIGAAITWWATREQSRRLWSAGALLLVVAAIKLVLFDFGSLGQLGNILAMMAAGGVFLLVAWLAPFPPKVEKKPVDGANLTSRPAPEAEASLPRIIQENPAASVAAASRRPIRVESIDSKASAGRGWLWVAAGVAAVGLVLYSAEQRAAHRTSALSELQGKAKYEKVAATVLAETQPTTVSDDATASPVASQASSHALPAAETPAPATELLNASSIGQAATTAIPEERPVADIRKFQSFEFDSNDSKSANPSICGFPNLVLPHDFTVVAAGGYSGRLTDFQIDQSGHQATQIDVAVHHPDKPVVLMLGAYEPTIWNIGWSAQTRVLAVVVSGYHRQAVAGLDKSVPVLNSSYDNKGACGYFYVSSERNEKLNPLSQRLFGRTVDMVYPAAGGKVLIGNSLPVDVRLITSSHTPVQSYYDKTAPLAGQAGLDDAVSRGILRPATAADAKRWTEAVARKSGSSLPPVAGARDSQIDARQLFKTYVIAKPFVFPSGLYGGNSATFFVLEGVPPPSGNPGHSRVNNFNAVAPDR
jgi:HAMP domain-containing protein